MISRNEYLAEGGIYSIRLNTGKIYLISILEIQSVLLLDIALKA